MNLRKHLGNIQLEIGYCQEDCWRYLCRNELLVQPIVLIDTLSKRKDNLLKDKSPNSLIALGAMEVHLNMALQALNAFNKGIDG